MPFTDCDIVDDIFSELNYGNKHNNSEYSCCELDSVKCSKNQFVNTLVIPDINVENEMKFPEAIVNLKNLTNIDISNNENIIDFPELKSIYFEKINLSNTSIAQPFPDWIMKQSSLKELDLSNTLITEGTSNQKCLFNDSIKKCNLFNTPLCFKLIKNETTNISLPNICIKSCGEYADTDRFEIIYFNSTQSNNNVYNNTIKNNKNTDILKNNTSNISNNENITSVISTSESSIITKNDKTNNYTIYLIVLFSIGILLLLLGFILLLYRYRRKKFNNDNYIFHSEDKPDDSSKFRKFFPFTTFKNANKYANNRATKTILDSNNVIMFNVDGCLTNAPGTQSDVSNNEVKDMSDRESKTKRSFKKFMKNCNRCHIDLVIFLDSLLRIRINDNNNKKYYKDRKKYEKERDDIQMADIPFGQKVSDDGMGCCSYNINNNDIDDFERMLNRESSEIYNNTINEGERNSEPSVNINESSSYNNILESEKAKIWNSIPVSNIKDRDKYTRNEAFAEIISVNSYKTTNDNSKQSNSIIETKTDGNSQNENTISTHDSEYVSAPDNSVSNGNFRISVITDNVKSNKKNNIINNRLSEPIISNNNLYNTSINGDNNETNDENRVINIENDEIDSLINRSVDNEKNLSFISSKRDSGINSFSKRVSGLLSLSFNKHNSLISESINEEISEPIMKTKQRETMDDEESERLLSERINEEMETEDIQDIQNADSNEYIDTEPITIERKSDFINRSSSVSGSINTYNSNFDSILNMYTNNYYDAKTELDDKYIFTTKNSNNNNNNNNNNNGVSKVKSSFINPNTLTYINGIKNKILKHNSDATKDIPSIQSSLEENENTNNIIDNKKEDNTESIHSHNPFLNGNIRNIYDNRNSIQSEQITNNYNSSLKSSFYSCKETSNDQSDNTNSYTTDSNIINIFEDNDDPFVYISNNRQMNVTVCPADTNQSNSTSCENSIDNMLNDMLNNKSVSVQRSNALISNKNNPFELNNKLIIPRKSSKRIANRQRDLLYKRNGMNVPNTMSINEKMKEIPNRASSLNYLKNGSINENSKLFTRKCMSYWNYETLMEDELNVYVGDIVYIIRVFDDGWIYGKNTRTNKVGVVPLCLLEKLNN